MHKTRRKIANWSLEDCHHSPHIDVAQINPALISEVRMDCHRKPNSMDQRNSRTIPGHFIQNSTVPWQSEKMRFSSTFPGRSRTAIIFQVFQDVWEPCNTPSGIKNCKSPAPENPRLPFMSMGEEGFSPEQL